MRMSKIAVTVSATMSVMAIASCVNEDYDLNKPIDMTVAVDGDISLPVIKNTKFISIKDLLGDTDLGENVIKVPFDADADPNDRDTKGYYVLKMTGDPDKPIGGVFGKIDFDIEESIKRFEPQPSIITKALTGKYIDLKDAIVAPVGTDTDALLAEAGIENPISISGKSPAEINGMLETLENMPDIVFSREKLRFPEVEMPIDGEMPIDIIVEDFPALIDEIGEISVGVDITFALNLNFKELLLLQGFEIDFPDRVTLMENDSDAGWIWNPENCTIRYYDDFTIYDNTDFKLRLIGIDGKDAIKETEAGRILEVHERIHFHGNAVLDTEKLLEYNSGDAIPEILQFTADAIIGKEVELGTAQVKFDVDAALEDMQIEDREIELGKILPEGIDREDVILDIYNPVIILSVENDSPIPATINAEIDAFDAEDVSVLDKAISLDGKLKIKANTKENPQIIAISRKGCTDDGVSDNIEIDDLGKLISNLPEKIAIKGIGIDVDKDADGYSYIDLGTLEKDKEFGLSCNYTICAPLAFGDALNIRYELEPITGLNSNFNFSDDTEENGLKINLSNLELEFTIANTLPIALGVEVIPIDLTGNSLAGEMTVEIKFNDSVSGYILSGDYMENGDGTKDTVQQETVVSIRIAPDNMNVLEKLDGVIIIIKGNAGDATGVPVNNYQGIRITDASLHITGGVEMNLGNMNILP